MASHAAGPQLRSSSHNGRTGLRVRVFHLMSTLQVAHSVVEDCHMQTAAAPQKTICYKCTYNLIVCRPGNIQTSLFSDPD